MPCIYYIPTKGVIAEHASLFVGEAEADLCFSLSEAPNTTYDVKKSEELTWSGRPCITSYQEVIFMDLNSAPIKMKEKPKFVEFIRSTSCGEPIRVDVKTLPINCWNVRDEAIVWGVPSTTEIDKLYFSISMTLLFWDF